MESEDKLAYIAAYKSAQECFYKARRAARDRFTAAQAQFKDTSSEALEKSLASKVIENPRTLTLANFIPRGTLPKTDEDFLFATLHREPFDKKGSNEVKSKLSK